MSVEPGGALLLRGKVVQFDGSAVDRYVLVRSGVIRAVSRRRPPLTDDAVVVQLGTNDWIFPGLVDLHSHTSKNILPLWEHNKGFFRNRFQWRADADYKARINQTAKTVKDRLSQKGKTAYDVFAELQAIAGGTTTLQEDWDIDRNLRTSGNPILCRGTGNPADLGLEPHQLLPSVTDFYRPDPEFKKAVPVRGNGSNPSPLDDYAADLKKRRRQATLAHLAEGRSGFGTRATAVDPYTRLEWESFMRHPAMQNAAAVRNSRLTLIHGCGIDVRDPKHVKFLRERAISIVWSPVSNLLLYGDTLEIEPLVNGEINVALGSDWSPSGSKHIWDEAKHARFFFQATEAPVSDVQMYQMVTVNPAQCLGIDTIGRIAPGCLADFFVLRSPLESDSAMEVFFNTTDADVLMVMIGGTPIYGDATFLKPFNLPLQKLPEVEGSAAANKRVYLPIKTEIDVDREISAIEAEFKKLEVYRSNLLVSSDKPYQRRIANLRRYMIDFGWRVRRSRRRQRDGLGREFVPSPCDAVRVWWGYRGVDADAFRRDLGALFIPAAVQTQAPLGMTAYLPAVLPKKKPAGVPDEIALVFYESRAVYQSTIQTVAGRAYSKLHATVFDKASESDFPGPLPAEVPPPSSARKKAQSFYLIDRATDWQAGYVSVLVGARPEKLIAENFREKVHSVLQKIQAASARTPTVRGAIGSISDDCFIYWELSSSRAPGHPSLRKKLRDLCGFRFESKAESARLGGHLFSQEQGVSIPEQAFYSFQFERRSEGVLN